MANENMNIIGAGQDTARPAPKKILDPCCGSKMMWFDRNDNRVIFADKRRGNFVTDTRPGRSAAVVDPNTVADFSNLPFEDSVFDLVVFDPPHLIDISEKSWLAKKYGVLKNGWQEVLHEGFSECFRVLRNNGVLIFKWAESHISITEILALTEQVPLFGNRSGKQMNTHWVCFMKEDRTSCAKIPAQNTMEICHTAPNTGSVKILLEKTKELIDIWRDSPEPGDASVFFAFEELDEFIAQNFTRA